MAPDRSTVELSRVRADLATLRGMGAGLLHMREVIDVDRITVTGSVTSIGDIDVAALLALVADGHAVEVIAQAGAWTLKVRGEAGQRPSLDMTGPPEQALPGASVDPMRRAYERGDALEALSLASDVGGSVSATLRNDPVATGTHWLPTLEALESLLSGPLWAAAARELTSGTSKVTIDDLTDTCVMTRLATFAGPDAACQQPQQEPPDAHYRELRIADGWRQLPSPMSFQPQSSGGVASDPGGVLLRLVSALQGTARRLVWYWLASEAHLEADGTMIATFSGARLVTVPILPGPADSAAPEIDLYEWAASSTDPARRESVHQAVSLALVTPADLNSAARPALRTAKLLYELAQRGAVAEAMAARRAARAAAADSARGTAQAAREAAGKAVERSLLQGVAAVGIVLSHASNLIDRSPALVLLGLVAIVALGSMFVALRVELPSAERGLKAELADLAQYRDTLSQDEIADVASAEAVKSARIDLKRARTTVVTVYVVAILVAMAIGGPLVLKRDSHSGETSPAKGSVPTVQVSVSP